MSHASIAGVEGDEKTFSHMGQKGPFGYRSVKNTYHWGTKGKGIKMV